MTARCGCAVNAPEADSALYPCPCGDHCEECKCPACGRPGVPVGHVCGLCNGDGPDVCDECGEPDGQHDGAGAPGIAPCSKYREDQ